MTRLLALCGASTAALTLCACAPVGPNFLKPQAIVSTQYKEIRGWKAATPRDGEAKGEWWRAFGDPELNRLEPAVVVSNQTVKEDEANYRQALALINQARAGLAPTLTGNASLTRGGPPAANQLNVEADANWTLDIWGQTRRQIESETANAEANAANLANATLAAQSSLALAYVQLREADSLTALLKSTVDEYRKALQIIQNQYTAGTTAKSDVISEQTLLLDAQASLIDAAVARAQSEHAIAVLMGRTPADLTIAPGALSEGVPTPPVRLPSTLLERRPDIAAAEETMRQNNAAIGVAMAAYYPTISLTGTFGYAGDPFMSQIGQINPVWSIGATLAQTLFNGGLTDAQVAAARATYDAGVATYRQTVLTAFQQVEDQLVAIRVLRQELGVREEAVRLAKQATEIAFNEYRAGTQAFTDVITAQQTELSAEESALTTRAALHTAAVSLIVALGGGWNAAKLPDAAADAASGVPSVPSH